MICKKRQTSRAAGTYWLPNAHVNWGIKSRQSTSQTMSVTHVKRRTATRLAERIRALLPQATYAFQVACSQGPRSSLSFACCRQFVILFSIHPISYNNGHEFLTRWIVPKFHSP